MLSKNKVSSMKEVPGAASTIDEDRLPTDSFATPSSEPGKDPAKPDTATVIAAQDDEATPPRGPIREDDTEPTEYPSGLRLFALISSAMLSVFLVALDRLIISTAIPSITNDFNSITHIGWYGSSYLIAMCAFQLFFGKLYVYFSIKAVFLASVTLFEIGSAICGAAPNSIAFIVGRAVKGIGAAGIFSGTVVVLVYAVPLHRRPLYQGLFGAVFGIASVAGPLLGGVFTSAVSWRWCFYINLPLGAVSMMVIFLLLKVQDRETTNKSLGYKLRQLDGLGTAAFVPGSVCVLLALQWGGVDYAWGSWRIVLLLVLGVLLWVVFVVVQVVYPMTATVPLRIAMNRSIAAGFWVSFTLGSSLMVFVYYIPVWFQAIQSLSAVDSGIRLIPTVLSLVVASAVSGALIHRIGYYTPVLIIGCCMMCPGSGLLTTFRVDMPSSKWIAYQFLYGFGLGSSFQAPNLAAQTVLKTIDVSIGVALMLFAQLLGGAIFLSAAQNVLNTELIARARQIFGDNIDPSFLNEGATQLVERLPEDIKSRFKEAYNDVMNHVFRVGMALTCLTILGALAMEWRSVKVRKNAHANANLAEDGAEREKLEDDASRKVEEGKRPEET